MMLTTVKKTFCVVALGLGLSGVTYAGKDPIGVSIFPESLPASVISGGGLQQVMVYTFRNNTKYTIPGTLKIGHVATPPDEFAFNDGCIGKQLAPGDTCQTTVTLTPKTEGEKKFHLIIQMYSNDVVPLPEQKTTANPSNATIQLDTSPQTLLPSSMNFGQSAPVLFSFSNTGIAAATNIKVTSSLPSNQYSTTCGSTLDSGQSCTASGTFAPTVSQGGAQKVTFTLTYAQGAPIEASTHTSVIVSGRFITAEQRLPKTITELSSGTQAYHFQYKFYNLAGDGGGLDLTQVPEVTLSDSTLGTLSFDTSADNDCSKVIIDLAGDWFPANSSCTVTGAFTLNSGVTGTEVLRAQMKYYVFPFSDDTVSRTDTTNIVSVPSGSRTITFQNKCGFPVWLGVTGGSNGTNTCTDDSDCPTGSRCDPAANNNQGGCFWEDYGPKEGSYKLAANTGTATVSILNYANNGTLWSGGFAARTGCTDGTCLTASCSGAKASDGVGACAVGQGFLPPVTQVEMTLKDNTTDNYDVEVINGFNVPVEIRPDNATSTNAYQCSAAGAPTEEKGFGACNWNNATPPDTTIYTWVGGGSGSSCSTSSPCTNTNEICGVNSGLEKVCGKFLGYWTANQICSVGQTSTALANQANALVQCGTALNSPYNSADGYSLTNLYSCSGKLKGAPDATFNSCYATYSSNGDQCCGCANWQDKSQFPGITLPAISQTQSQACADANNVLWTNSVQDKLLWMKRACPNYYIYPYDDPTSGFSCTNAATGSTANTTNYTVTFCPGGASLSGLPSGKEEGRNG